MLIFVVKRRIYQGCAENYIIRKNISKVYTTLEDSRRYHPVNE
jgi:hypothetical protein